MSKVIVDRVASKLGCTKKDAAEYLKAVVSAIQDEIVDTGNASIINFGSFTTKNFKRVSVLNNITYNVDTNLVQFKAGSGLSKSVNP